MKEYTILVKVDKVEEYRVKAATEEEARGLYNDGEAEYIGSEDNDAAITDIIEEGTE